MKNFYKQYARADEDSTESLRFYSEGLRWNESGRVFKIFPKIFNGF